MGYRKNNEDPYRMWRIANARELVRLGIPHEFVKNGKRFLGLIMDGHELGQDWDASWIAAENVEPLRKLLREQFDDESIGLVPDLEKRVGDK